MRRHAVQISFLRPALACLLWAGMAGAAFAQQDFSQVEIEVIPVADGVHMLVGRGGNIGVSTGEDGVIVIDDQFAPLHGKIVKAIASIRPDPIRFVLNTHWHGDHVGGNEALSGLGAIVVAHDNVRERMSSEQFNALFDRRTPPSPEAALPVVTFGADVTLHLNGEEIHVFHVPKAHTDGDVLVHFRKADVLHTGDVFFASGYPFIDRSSGGSINGLIVAVDRALDIAGPRTRIIPGHGPLSDEPGLTAYRGMLASVRDRVKAAMAGGKSLEALVAEKPLADLDERWGGGFIDAPTLLRTVYESLAGS